MGKNKPWDWGKEVGHLWRTTGDITNCFDCVVDHGTWKSWGVMQILDMQKGLRVHAGPDHWNDPDMMEVGNGMSVNEDRAHFSMWCMLAAPLIAGNDLRNMSQETRAIVTNKGAIAINQDSLGIQAFKYLAQDSVEIWFKPLMNDEWAVCFLNRAKNLREVSFNWQGEMVIDEFSGRTFTAPQKPMAIHDIWAQKDGADTNKEYKAKIPGHDVRLLRLNY